MIMVITNRNDYLANSPESSGGQKTINDIHMKKSALLILAMIVLLQVFSQTNPGKTQKDSIAGFPPFTLLLPDNRNVMVKDLLPENTPILLILFHPDCDHCQQETEDITKRIKEFEHIQIIMATPASYDQMKKFWVTYELTKYKNIMIGQDHKVMMPTYFNISKLPFIAFYSAKKELIGTHEGPMKVAEILTKFKKQ